MNGKHFLIATLISIALVTVVFTPLSGQHDSTYDPWIDYNNDGTIDVNDLSSLGQAYGTSGNPTRNVNVTNWPIATNHLTTILSDTNGSARLGPMIITAFSSAGGIGGKSVTFLSGAVSGGATFNTIGSTGYQYAAGGGAPGAGRVAAYDSGYTLLAEFALPLYSMFTVHNVDSIAVYAEATIPLLESDIMDYHSSYAIHVVASVYWIEQA